MLVELNSNIPEKHVSINIRIFEKVQLYFLKMKLGKLFDKAEQLVQAGVESGDPQYVDLHNKANELVDRFAYKYPHAHVRSEIPALENLRVLTVPKPPMDPKKPLIVAGILAVSAVAGLGLIAAAIEVSYHGWLNLFHFIHIG